jgi:hypothetical protein
MAPSFFVYPSPSFTVLANGETAPTTTTAVFPLSLVSAKKDQSLVDKNSEQPASKGAFIFKVRQLARCGPPAVLYGNSYCALIAEYTVSDEV